MVEESRFEEVKTLLKQEFFGIDEQIDKVIDAIKTWCVIKDYQIKPSVYNLWGLTGCGKTMLINRTLELLDLNNLLFDVKVNSNLDNLKYKLKRSKDSTPIFLFDEIQFLKTLDEHGCELDMTENKPQSMIFDLIDLGRVTVYDHDGYHYNISRSLWLVIELLEKKIDLVNGCLKPTNTEGYHFIYNLQKQYSDYMEFKNHSFFTKDFSPKNWDGEVVLPYKHDNSDYEYEKTIIEQPNNCQRNDSSNPLEKPIKTKTEKREVKVSLYNLLYQNNNEMADYLDCRNLTYKYTKNKHSQFKFNIWLETATMEDVKKLYDDIHNTPEKPLILDFSKSLVFVAGNLDEAYTMNKAINSELDADWFHNKTKKISFIDIKTALQRRFRNEQISRLGTNHIIYPSLSSEAFKQIINKRLSNFKDICKKIIPTINDVVYDKHITNLIYKEGVFPVQGARPIFGVVSNIISNQLPEIIKFYKKHGEKIYKIYFNYNSTKKIIIVELLDSKGNTIETFSKKYLSILDAPAGDRLTKNQQLSHAVHEVGHAIATIVLEKKTPDYIFSKTKDTDQGDAFVLNSDYAVLTKKNWINRIAISYGGIVAEELVFGKDNIHAGSASDLESATHLANELILNYGFFYLEDGLLGQVGWKDYQGNMQEASGDKRLKDEDLKSDEYLKQILKEAKLLAEEAIKKEKDLFVALVDYLSAHNKMNKKQIKKFIEQHLKSISIEDLDKQETFNIECFENFKNEPKRYN